MNADDLAKLLGGANITINIHNGKGDIHSGVEIHASPDRHKKYRCSCGYESNNVFDFGQYGCLKCSQKRLHEEQLKIEEDRLRLADPRWERRQIESDPSSSGTIIISEPSPLSDEEDRKRPYYDPKGPLSKH